MMKALIESRLYLYEGHGSGVEGLRQKGQAILTLHHWCRWQPNASNAADFALAWGLKLSMMSARNISRCAFKACWMNSTKQWCRWSWTFLYSSRQRVPGCYEQRTSLPGCKGFGIPTCKESSMYRMYTTRRSLQVGRHHARGKQRHSRWRCRDAGLPMPVGEFTNCYGTRLTGLLPGNWKKLELFTYTLQN